MSWERAMAAVLVGTACTSATALICMRLWRQPEVAELCEPRIGWIGPPDGVPSSQRCFAGTTVEARVYEREGRLYALAICQCAPATPEQVVDTVDASTPTESTPSGEVPAVDGGAGSGD